MIDHSTLKATPEQEDFAHKYTEEGNGKIGKKLLDGYFRAVYDLTKQASTDKQNLLAHEIGCGEGFSTARLHDILPKTAKLSASEYVSEMIPRARERNPGVNVFQESAYELKNDDKSLDIVYLLEVLEHLDHPNEALAEIKRVVKPNGYVILGVPREPLWCMLNLLRGKYVRHFGNTPGHLNHWSKNGLKRYMKKQGFRLVQSRSPLPWTLVLIQKER